MSTKALVPVASEQTALIQGIYRSFQSLWDMREERGSRLSPDSNWKRNNRPYAALREMRLPLNPNRFYYFTDGFRRTIVRAMRFNNMALCFAMDKEQYYLDYVVPIPTCSQVEFEKGPLHQLRLLQTCIDDLLDDVSTPHLLRSRLF